jgi:bacterioferritin-associated ferredoxin
MIVCSCNVITDHEVRGAVSAPDASGNMSQIYRELGRTPQCGHCKRTIKDIVRNACAESDGRCTL